MRIKKTVDELQKIALTVKCPECERKIRFKEEIDLEMAFETPASILDAFDSMLFQCTCGNEFLGAETRESDLIEDLIEIFNELKDNGKVLYDDGNFFVDIGIFEGLRYLKKLKNIGEKHGRGDIFE